MSKTATSEVSTFAALVKRAHATGRLSAPQERLQKTGRLTLVGMRLLPSEIEQAKELAAADDRALATFCRRMYQRGLESYMAEHGAQQ